MKVAKIKRKEQKKTINSTDVYSIKEMIKILIILLIIFSVFYLITKILVKENKENSNNSVAVIDSSKITLNQLLNRKEDEYYVIATKASLYESSYVETNYINFYNEYIYNYKQKESSLAFYYVDLDSALNKMYISEELNLTNDISKLKLNDEVLFKIKNGKIEKTYIGKDKIIEKLSKI